MKHENYFNSDKRVEVGHIARFDRLGDCEVITVDNGEALGKNLATEEEFWLFCSYLDFVSKDKISYYVDGM